MNSYTGSTMHVRDFFGALRPQRLLKLAFRLRAHSEYLVCDKQRLTRTQTLDGIEALAAGLQAQGIGRGDRIVSLLPARPEAVFALFLPHVLGSINVPLNPLLGAYELQHILANCQPACLLIPARLYGRDYLDLLADLLPDPPPKLIVVVDGSEGGSIKDVPVRAYHEILQPDTPIQWVRPTRANQGAHKRQGDDITRITYTSGATSLPKGVVHTRARAWGLAMRSARSRLDPAAMRSLLLPFPLYHFAGMFGVYAALLAGGKVVLMERFHPQRLLEGIVREQVTQLAGSPTMYRLMLAVPGQERFDLTSLRRVTTSSDVCTPDLAQALHERLACPIENIYSTTECNMIAWTDPGDDWRRVAETVGRPAPGVRVRIVDRQRQPLPPGAVGEIAAQTSQMMQGYYRDPELTRQTLDEEGWFYTGDLGCMGEDGYLRLTGRAKDVIIRGGENIGPAEIEAFLETHPAILRAGVVGMTDALAGERIWAFLQLTPGQALSSEQAKAYCRGQLAPFKQPDVVRFIDHLPVTAAGKLQRYRLRQLAAHASPEEERVIYDAT